MPITSSLARLQVSTNQRFLVTETGSPFFWLADTAWEMFHRLSLEEADIYLENRRKKNFNVIQAVLLSEFDGLRSPNAYGQLPLIDEDPARPNPAFFEHVDALIQMAAVKGLYVGVLPTWGDKVNSGWGMGPVVFTPENAQIYGRWLGERYRDVTNIVWIVGGDRPVLEPLHLSIWRALAAGLRAGNPQALMTFHPCGHLSSSSWFHTDDWLSFNMMQSGHNRHDWAVWEMIASDYAYTPTKPTLDGESNYEDHPVNWDPANGYFRDHDVRKQAYRSVFAGACGITYGNYDVFPFYRHSDGGLSLPPTPELPFGWHERYWEAALDRPGAGQLQYLRRLMESRPYFDRVPDPTLLQPTDGDWRLEATRAADSSYTLIYVPYSNQTFNVNLHALPLRLTTWWYNPRTGAAQTGPDVPHIGGWHTFKSPLGGPDWVLVLDDATRNFPPPGQSTP